MPMIKLTDEQAEELRDVLQVEIDRLEHLVGDSVHSDDLSDLHRKSVCADILHLLEIA